VHFKQCVDIVFIADVSHFLDSKIFETILVEEGGNVF